MNIYLHKILPLLVSPLFLFIVLTLFYAIRYRLKVLFVSAIALSILSTPITAHFCWEKLESGYKLKAAKSQMKSDAIVVLSGNGNIANTEQGPMFQWSDPDRFFGGIALFNANKAPTLIFTGGQLPWDIGDKTEGDYLKDEAVLLGVPKEHIYVTREVQNTAQEANAVRALLKDKNSKIILVTSAYHMPRASKLFEANKLNVTPFPVDFKSTNKKLTIMSFIPSTGGLDATFTALREFLGRLYYRIRA